MRNRPLLEAEYNILLIKNSHKVLGVSERFNLIGEVEKGIVAMKLENPPLRNIMKRLVEKKDFFSGFLDSYRHRLSEASDAIIAARKTYAQDKKVDFESLFKEVYSFCSLSLDYSLPYDLFDFLSFIAAERYGEMDESEAKLKMNDLHLSLTSDYFYKTERAILSRLKKNYQRGFKGFTDVDIKVLVREVGYLQRDGLLPHRLEAHDDMRRFAEGFADKYDSYESASDALDNLFFRQRVNHQLYWKEKNLMLESMSDRWRSYGREAIEFITLGLKFNEDNRVVRNSLFSFLSNYLMDNFEDVYNTRLGDLIERENNIH